MNLKLKNTPEQVELIKAMGSKNRATAREAQEAFAAFLGPVVRQVLNQAGTAGAVYTDVPFDEDDSPSYPLDLYYNEGDNYVQTWSQSVAGGLPTSAVDGMAELKISTYRLDSAVSFLAKYARRARLDVISKGVERMSQEVLVKQERNAWAVILKALAEASTNSLTHVVTGTTANEFQLHDLNKLMTRIRRINESFADGTPDPAYSQGVTDLYVSPEIMQNIRSFAYQPMNTRAAVGTADKDSTGLALPDNVRSDIYNAAGTQEIYGINIVELNEFGVSKKYNTLFDTFATSAAIDGPAGSDFATGTDEILVGIDNSKGAFVRPIARNAESGSTFVALPDNQFATTRVDKAGFYGALEEGRVCLDARAVGGIIFKD